MDHKEVLLGSMAIVAVLLAMVSLIVATVITAAHAHPLGKVGARCLPSPYSKAA